MTEQGNLSPSNEVALGIDAGGTFTDLVIFDPQTEDVLTTAKVPTQHENMLQTLEEGLETILQGVDTSRVKMINFATTFATNAIVENKMRPVQLILIGYSEDSVLEAQAKQKLGVGTVATVAGGHKVNGEELAPLDEDALTAIIGNLSPEIEGVALSGFFSIRNPSHELRAAQIIRELRPDLPITSGHELTWELDAFKRATTASLNAGLIPIIIELIDALVEILRQRGIAAPLTVVRGDGTAVGQAWAKLHPVEMLLSGPAASAVGAGFIAAKHSHGTRDMWICDIGGTTSDIVALDVTGTPKISKDGATVGSHRTLVKSIDIYTFGQGGDSQVTMQANDAITIGPMRIIPLCVAAQTYPSILEDLQRFDEAEVRMEPLFVLPSPNRKNTDSYTGQLLEAIGDRPACIYDLSKRHGFTHVSTKYVTRMANQGLLTLAGFTPTDAFHVLGSFTRWDTQASAVGARLLCSDKRFIGDNRPTAEAIATRVQNQMVANIAAAIYKKSIADLLPPKGVSDEIAELIAKALDVSGALQHSMPLHLNSPLVGAGAPSALVISEVAERLHCAPILAEKAEVAGAIGAAVGTFAFSGIVRISHPKKEVYRVHHTRGISDFDDLELAVAHAQEIMHPWLTERAQAAGVTDAIIGMERHDVTVNESVYLWTELHFTVSQAAKNGATAKM